MDWQTLHDKFMVLMREEDDIVQGDRAALRAIGNYGQGGCGRWRLCDAVKESLTERFLALATEAARLHGCPRGAWPWQQWLHSIKLYLESSGSKHLRKSDAIYKIERLAESAAMLCARLQRQELEMETLGIEEIMVLEAGEALEDAEHETAGLDAKNEGEAQAEVPLGDRRRALVDSFLQRCNEHSSATIRRKHLWLIVGHSKGRQFERWQAGSSQATDADERNFKRILETPAQKFVEDLKLRKLL